MESIVYRGKTKNALSYVIRYPNKNDAGKMRRYINTISKEKTFIRYQGEIVTLAQEKSFLKNQLIKISNNRAVMLLIETDKELFGISGIDMRDRSEKHTAEFGISILSEIRGQGIGKLLMYQVLKEAIKRLPGLKIITLSVFANNNKAVNMYKNFGFVEYGNLKGGVLYRGKPVDHVYMYKKIK